jgi:lipoyl(octanoyl) transferase
MTAVWRWLGRVPFAPTAELQERIRQGVLTGRGPETLLLCEHDPVITLGRSARAANILARPDELARRGVAVHAASRGGDVTYHGPGQLVGYPILRLRAGVVGHLTAMASGVAAVLSELGIASTFRRDAPGLWVEPRGASGAAGGTGAPAKICAFGVNVQRRVAIHGFALNVATELSAFDLIVPCGLPDATVTSIAAFRSAPSLEALAARAAEMLGSAYGVSFAFEEEQKRKN